MYQNCQIFPVDYDMRTALILPNNVWFCPYVNIYINILKELSIDYDVISWNRDGSKEDAIQYNYKLGTTNPIMLLFAYLKFARFVKKTVIKHKYDNLIVFTPQSSIFLSRFLRTCYKGKYIFDYRDLSIEQKRIFKGAFNSVLKNSYINVISSPGFKEYLPREYNYILSHNFDIVKVRESLGVSFKKKYHETVEVLTIGGIRDYESNAELIQSLADCSGVSMRFVGKGPSAEGLSKLANENKVGNITFEGYYPKEIEGQYILNADFMNIYYPRRPSHDSALSNRFYNALIYKVPMITTSSTIQGNFTEKYNLGVAIDNCENLSEKLSLFRKNVDMLDFSNRCDCLLNNFIEDYTLWERLVRDFYTIVSES